MGISRTTSNVDKYGMMREFPAQVWMFKDQNIDISYLIWIDEMRMNILWKWHSIGIFFGMNLGTNVTKPHDDEQKRKNLIEYFRKKDRKGC